MYEFIYTEIKLKFIDITNRWNKWNEQLVIVIIENKEYFLYLLLFFFWFLKRLKKYRQN